ncbi:MAG: hypothetical protein ACI4WT_01155 [Oligosphaeraceae bacterium]
MLFRQSRLQRSAGSLLLALLFALLCLTLAPQPEQRRSRGDGAASLTSPMAGEAVLLALREGPVPERPPQPRQRAAAPPAPAPLLPTGLQRPVGRLIPKSNVSFTAARTCVCLPLRL